MAQAPRRPLPAPSADPPIHETADPIASAADHAASWRSSHAPDPHTHARFLNGLQRASAAAFALPSNPIKLNTQVQLKIDPAPVARSHLSGWLLEYER